LIIEEFLFFAKKVKTPFIPDKSVNNSKVSRAKQKQKLAEEEAQKKRLEEEKRIQEQEKKEYDAKIMRQVREEIELAERNLAERIRKEGRKVLFEKIEFFKDLPNTKPEEKKGTKPEEEKEQK